MTQIFYRMFFRSVISVIIVVTAIVELAIACGKYEYVTNAETCLPCRICPVNIHNAQDRVISDCPVSSPSWLPGKFIGCSGPHDPLPWCELWSDEHGNVTCLYGNMTVGSNCTLQCTNGYAVDVDYTWSQCTGNLTWFPTTKPACRPIPSRNNHTTNGYTKENVFNITEIGSAEEVLVTDAKPRDDYIIIGGSVGSAIFIILVFSVILWKRFKIKEKICNSHPDGDGTVLLSTQMNGVVNDANMFVLEEPAAPEITEENADERQLIKVYENRIVMERLVDYLERSEQKYRVTWHVIGREILHLPPHVINRLEYHRRGDNTNGPFNAIMELMKGHGVKLKQILDFLYEFKRNVPQSQEVDNHDINDIIDLLNEFVKSYQKLE
ncbi:uncharacterized protein LOC126829369 isoform X2 [Patella vulgata]|uniref:uncharacterized protein LOC126829369 isoform X2 n=1 Tax=Patella vulgata TaxID=6465 RepID=UPI0024A848C0|nr:uncharacterized protein LOC126829369 isoform X2 [Patella vulgata]